jgi:uncharacterized protein YcfJ
MKPSLKLVVGAACIAAAAQAAAQVTVYSRENFQGESFSTDRNIHNLERAGLDRRALSIAVQGGNWQLCEDADFSGRCQVVGPGEYRSLWDMGIDRVVSMRAVDRVAAGGPVPAYDYHRRSGEPLYEAQVMSVRAVVGPPETRCWIERQQVVSDNRGGPNVPGAIAGAVIGGVLGHQIGSGRGNDIATAGGAVAGAAIGANVGNGSGPPVAYDRDVQRCASAPRDTRPDYWDVTYNFRGVAHHMQTQEPPGATVVVNGDGEPRL